MISITWPSITHIFYIPDNLLLSDHVNYIQSKLGARLLLAQHGVNKLLLLHLAVLV